MKTLVMAIAILFAVAGCAQVSKYVGQTKKLGDKVKQVYIDLSKLPSQPVKPVVPDGN